jgi:tetratricopeptide (TPR) repeat protein
MTTPDVLTYDDLPPDIQSVLDAAYGACDLGRYDQAIPGLTDVVDAYPTYIHGVFTLGLALRKTGAPDRARERFAAAASVAPDDPRICLGLAWSRLDEGDQAAAGDLAARGLRVDAPSGIRGSLLAVMGWAAESEGRNDDAAQRYLEAYEARPEVDWLEAHCRLAGVPYRRRKGLRAPWPIGAADRRWMYSAIAAALAEIAYAKNPDVPDVEVLVAGCDGSAQVTARWAARGGVDRARLYQALTHRGGYCDCEVLLNAASEDDEELGLALVVGALDGTIDDALPDLRRFLVEEPPLHPPKLEAGTEVPEECIGIFVHHRTGRIPLQVTDAATVGEVLRAVADGPPDQARLRLLVGFHGEAPVVVQPAPEGGLLRTGVSSDGPASADLERAWPGISSLLHQLRAALSGRAP